ncbi:uncharacterized protein FA14DRAFT_62902 [Meira miltonrushii]|uniref:Ubinuclein middle domain-containing protein n=1 Tax=Meira miltonrushii TaxID=1280837 RepID=A0A316V8Z6_9BASI|nr:uncharacterized protein FA14DRAFT_62902 [Meira miltonrushii]PWN33508.1 hypothetical protein FA14DRAFT_62902 [Meira miltonrushii]
MAEGDPDDVTTTPSRISVQALMSPAQSPKPTANGNSPEVNGNQSPSKLSQKLEEENHADEDGDVEFVDANEGTSASRINPSRKAKSIATEETAEELHATAGQSENEDEEEDESFGVAGQEQDEGVEDDEDDEEDSDEDEEDEEDDDDDDEDDDDSSEGDTAEDKSEMEGVEKAIGAENNSESTTAHKETNGNSSSSAQPIENDNAEKDEVMTDAQKEDGAEKKGKKGLMKKKLKRRSPSVELVPAGPPPRPTVRIKISLAKNEEDAYMTNIPDEVYKVLKEKDDAWAKWYATTLPAEEEPEEEKEGDRENGDGANYLEDLGGLARLLQKYPVQGPSDGKGKGKGKGKKSEMEYEIGEYDTKDPFVDDSELNVDEPTYSAKPSASGFFVVEGEIELEEVERSKLEAQREELLLLNAGKRGQMPAGFGQTDPGPDGTDAGGAGAIYVEKGADATNASVINTMLSRYADVLKIAPLSEEEQAEEAKEGETENGKDGERSAPFAPIQAIKYPTKPVPRRLEKEFIHLRQLAAKESWLKKSKFPPDLRDPLVRASMVAIALDEFNDNFFNWLPQIFPYNRHTLNKYVRRQTYNDHVALMKTFMDMQEKGMKRQIDSIHEEMTKSFDEAMIAWQARGSRDGTPTASGNVNEEKPAEEAAEKELGEGELDEADEDGANPPVNKNDKPVKRWPWTEPLRETLFTIMTIDNAMTEIRTEKNELENSKEKMSVINARKAIYKRLIELWPESGLTTTTALSNQYGLYKKKVDKFALMLHGSTAANGVIVP